MVRMVMVVMIYGNEVMEAIIYGNYNKTKLFVGMCTFMYLDA